MHAGKRIEVGRKRKVKEREREGGPRELRGLGGGLWILVGLPPPPPHTDVESTTRLTRRMG